MTGKKTYQGSMTVEMAALFPLVFFLLMLLLRMWFWTMSVLLLQTVQERSGMIWQETGTEEGLSSFVRARYQESPLPSSYRDSSCVSENTLWGERVQINIRSEFALWTRKVLSSSRSVRRIRRASFRDRLDLAWELGEELPVVGDQMRKYEEKLEEIRKKLEEMRG